MGKSNNPQSTELTLRTYVLPRMIRASALIVLSAAGFVSTGALAEPSGEAPTKGYTFTRIAALGDTVPGGILINDFEPDALNSRGDVIFGADLGTSADPSSFFGEGVFLSQKRQISELARGGMSAPGGGAFELGVFRPSSLNDRGDAAFVFALSPFRTPWGVNSGLYRYSHAPGTLTSVLLPYITAAPDGSIFSGAAPYGTSLNDRGELVFSGIIPTSKGIHVPGEDYVGLGAGLYKADPSGRITAIVVPGDRAPGGGTFDYAVFGRVSDKGDIAFGAHVAGEPCLAAQPQAAMIYCGQSIYFKQAATGEIKAIEHQGDPAPGGGIFQEASEPVLNNRGDIAFTAGATPGTPIFGATGVYLYSNGQTLALARPGDPMPGGGNYVTQGNFFRQLDMNSRGDVLFNATLDNDSNGDGIPDTGLFLWSQGTLHLVVRSGSVIEGMGTVAHLHAAAYVGLPWPSSGALINDRGQLVFEVTLTDGRCVLLQATPEE